MRSAPTTNNLSQQQHSPRRHDARDYERLINRRRRPSPIRRFAAFGIVR